MKKVVGGTFCVLLMLPVSSALAETKVSDVSALGVAIDVLLFVAGLLCFVMCLKIFTLLRGGELSPGWQMLAVSFLILSIGQVLSLSIELELVALHKNAISILHLLALFLIVLGVAKIKKSLT